MVLFGDLKLNDAVCLTNAVTATILKFVKLFQKALEENVKQDELEKKKALKDAEMEKAAKWINPCTEDFKISGINFSIPTR